MKSVSKSWIVVLATSLFFFYAFIQMNLFNAINEAMTSEFGFSAQQISQLFSSYFWGNVFFVFPAGIVLDRFSVKKTVMLAFLTAIIANYAFSVAHSFQFLWLARLIVGISGSFCFLGAVKMTSQWFSPSKMGFTVSIFVALATLGGVVAQRPLSALTLEVGWRLAMRAVSFFGLILLVLQFCLVEDKKESKVSQAEFSGSAFLTSLKMVLLNKQNWLGGIFISLLNFPSMVFGGSWGVPFLKQVHNFTDKQATTITTAIFLGMILGSPLAGYYSDKLSLRKRPMYIGSVGTLLIIFAVMYLPGYSLIPAALLFFVMGVVMGFQVVGYPVIAESNPLEVTATASSIGSILIMGAGTIVAWYGKLLDLGGSSKLIHSSQDFLRANWLVLGGVIVTLLATIFVKETFGKSYSPTQNR